MLAQEVVRGQPVGATRHQASSKGPNDPAHPSKPVIAQLNEKWRVIDDPLQWILQRKKGNPRNKNSGWQPRSFCRTREALLRCVREHCCSPDNCQLRSIREYRGVDKAALQQLRALPEWHLDWDRTNLDVHGTDLAQRDWGAKPLGPKASEVPDADE